MKLIAKDLMVGDYVFAPNRTYSKVTGVGKVIQLDKTTLLEEVEPIPLTPESLETNGFGKLVTYGTEKWIYGDMRMNIYSPPNGCWRFCADTKRNENSVIYIYFVHELQHALRLCGIKTEIKL